MAPKKPKTAKPTKKFADRKPPRPAKKPVRLGTMQDHAPKKDHKQRDDKKGDTKKSSSKNISPKNSSQKNINAPQHDNGPHAVLKKYRTHDYLYGIHAVETALKNPKRHLKILVVSSAKQDEYAHIAEESDLKIIILSNDEISHILPQGAVHQGLALIASPLPQYEDVQNMHLEDDTVMVLDGVTDPQNVGAILRVCAAFGCKSLMMQDRSAPSITGALAKSAAGATEYVDIVRVKNLARSVRELGDNGYMIYGADGGSETSLPDVKFHKKSVIIMGSEGNGMRRLVREACDYIVSIPMNAQMESLNVSVASGILLGQAYFGRL